MNRLSRVILCGSFIVASLVFIACGGGGSPSKPTVFPAELNPAPDATPTSAATPTATDAMIRVQVWNDTKANPMHPKAAIWFKGSGHWWLKSELQHGATSRNLGPREINAENSGKDAIAFYPDGYDLDPKILIPFKITSKMNPEGSDRDALTINVGDDEVEITGLPLKAATGDFRMRVRRAGR